MTRSSSLATPQMKLANIEALIRPQGDGFVAYLDSIRLASCFQPIYSLSHQRVVGYEGLIRAQQACDTVISPLSFFARAENEQETVLQDRLCRTLHIKNFINQTHDHWLFLNVSPLVTVRGKQYGAFFAELLERYGIPPHRIVVEILEGQIDDEKMLAEAVSYYKSIGCLVAIDDFGAGHSNFERIWTLRPSIVKLDRSIIERAGADRTISRIIPRLVSLIHEAGSLVLIEGIETQEQALIAMHADADFVQGYYFAKPNERLLTSIYHRDIGNLFSLFKDSGIKASVEYKRILSTHVETFQACVQQIAAGVDAATAIAAFLVLPDVERCYLLSEAGTQLGSNFCPPSRVSIIDPRFEPLSDATHAIWSRRHYFQKAVQQPGIVHVSNPYLSITGGTMCVTLSIAFTRASETLVCCGDIEWMDS